MRDSKVLKAGIGYTIGNYLLKGLSFFTIPIFARLLTTEDYGIVNTFGAYESILFVLIGLAIHSSFKNARYKYGLASDGSEIGKDYETYVSNAYSFISFSAIIWFVLVLLFRNVLSRFLGLEPSLLLLLVLYSSANALVIAYNTHIGISFEYKKFLKVAFSNAIGNIIISLFLILSIFSEKRYMGRIIGTVLPVLIVGIGIAVLQFRRKKPHNTISMMKWGLKYSLPIVPHGISQIILSSFDRLMINRMISASATGLYSFAYNIFVIIQVTAGSIDSVWGPWFYGKRNEDDLKSIKKYSSIYTVFLAAFCVVIMLVSPELIRILGGEKYSDSVYCVIPIVAGGFFTMLYNIPASVEYYYEKTSYIASATTVAAVLNIGLNFVFINRYGYIAAAYTTFLTYLLYFVFHFYMAYKIEKKNIFDGFVIVSASVSTVLGAVITMICLPWVWVRWGMSAVIIVGFLLIEEKREGLIRDYIRTRKSV